MSIAIRVDSGASVGEGHFRRCYIIAETLRQKFFIDSVFICSELTVTSRDALLVKGYALIMIKSQHEVEEAEDLLQHPLWSDYSVGTLLVDSYRHSYKWEARLSSLVNSLVVLDDLADRVHHCDQLFDPSPLRHASDYQTLVPAQAKINTGLKYAILSASFQACIDEYLRGDIQRDEQLIHLFFGSTDHHNFTCTWLNLLLDLCPGYRFKVAVGYEYQYIAELRDIMQRYAERVSIDHGVTDMARHLVGCGLAIGAPGTATWERLCLKIPSLLCSTVDNQVDILQALHKENCIYYVGHAESPDVAKVLTGLEAAKKGALSGGMKQLELDGNGASRVARILSETVTSSRSSARSEYE